MVSETVSTQIRLPADLHQYIQQEAARLGIAQNAFMIVLMEQGKRVWIAEPILHLKE
jgi:hypothetical protein